MKIQEKRLFDEMSKKKYSEILFSGLGRKYQLEQMKAKDKRVKLMNEILGGVKGGFQLLNLIITELKSHMTC